MNDSILSPLSPNPGDEYISQSAHPHSANRSHGTPANTQLNGGSFYSMSVPVQGFHSTTSGVGQSLGTSYGSYGQSPMNVSSNSLENQGEETGRVSVDALNEKRRKRRESHNAVERRRRDHINEKIQELSSLLPEFASDAQNKPNKGVILRRSVEYIRHMQLFAARQMDRTLELEQCLMRLCQARGIDESELGLAMPLGTPIQLPALTQHSAQDLDGPDAE
ncbi:Transcription factor E3 [Kappamyces sp. JEL0829]|nr:Transcription factor E3 [Kappamyces sp. JEL0829]